MILLVLDALVVREAGEEDGALVAAGLGAPLTAEQPHQVIVHRAVVAAEPRGQGRQVDLDAVIAGGITAVQEGLLTAMRSAGLFGQKAGLRWRSRRTEDYLPRSQMRSSSA